MSLVQQLEQELHDQPKNPLRPDQRKDWQDERDRLQAIVNQPAWVGGDRGHARKRYNELTRLLDAQIPKAMEPERRDKVARLSKQVMAEVIQPTLQSRAVMRRNPAGAIDGYFAGENSTPIKRAILTWKRARFAVEPESDERDLANVERYRPEGVNPDGTSTFMAGAQIPGIFAMTPQAKANWPLGEPAVATPLKQAQAQEPTPPPKRISHMSPEARQRQSDRLKAQWVVKRAQEQAARELAARPDAIPTTEASLNL